MQLDDLPTPTPGVRQALVKLGAGGINFIDIYQRSGAYKVPLPFALGLEGDGTVETLGPNVTDVKVGDRVARNGSPGSYATHAVVPAA